MQDISVHDLVELSPVSFKCFSSLLKTLHERKQTNEERDKRANYYHYVVLSPDLTNIRVEERVCMAISIYSINPTTWRHDLASTFSVIFNLSSHIFCIIGVFPLIQHFEKHR